MPNFNATFPDYTGDYKKDFLNIQDSFISLKKSFDYHLSHLNEDNIYQMTGENGDVIFDRQSFNSAHAKWFKNLCENSNFEIFDSATLIPYGWDGGASTSTSSFFETYGLMLKPAETSTQTVAVAVNPSLYADQSATTRVAFYKKLGAVKVYVLDRDTDNPYTVTDKDGNEGTYIEFPYNANWGAEKYTLTCIPTGATRVKLKFENSDGSYNAYIDAIVIEPEYNGNRPSLYTNGPYSLGYANGTALGAQTVSSYRNSNAANVTVTTAETTIATKEITLSGTSDIFISFSAELNPTDALTLTAKTYLDTTARTYQPQKDVFGTGNYVFTYSDIMKNIDAGTYDITVKMLTSASTTVVPADFGVLSILVIAQGLETVSDIPSNYTLTELESFEYDTSQSTFNSAVTIDSTHIAVAYLNVSNYVILKTFSIGGSGNIALIDSLTVATGSDTCSLTLMNSTHLAVAYTGADADGYIATFSIDANANNITLIDTLEHDTARGTGHVVAAIDSTHIVMVYNATSLIVETVKTFSVDASYGNITEIDSYAYAAISTWYSIAIIDSTHFAIARSDSSNDGHITTFSIDGSYANITIINDLEHDLQEGRYNSLLLIDSIHLFLAYKGYNDDGFVKTFSFDGSYANITQIAVLEHDVVQATFNSAAKIDATHFMVAYTDVNVDGQIKTFSIDGLYQNITEISVVEFDTDLAAYSSLVKLKNLLYAVAYTGTDSDGFIKTFSID